MRIALIRRVSITGFDGVNKFIALLAEGFARLGHEPVIISLCHEGVEDRELTRWFKEAHGLDLEIPIHTLRHGCGGSWLSIAWNWCWKGSKLLRKAGEVKSCPEERRVFNTNDTEHSLVLQETKVAPR